MNTDTGRIYTDPNQIKDALRRGEPLEPIGPRVAEFDKNGMPYVSPEGHPVSRKERRAMSRRKGRCEWLP